MSFKPLVRTLRSSDGIPIHAEFVGDKGNPCLVLIHGFTMSCPVWDNIFQDAAMLGEVCMVSVSVIKPITSFYDSIDSKHADSL